MPLWGATKHENYSKGSRSQGVKVSSERHGLKKPLNPWNLETLNPIFVLKEPI